MASFDLYGELLREYYAEKGMSKEEMINLLNTDIFPFDANFTKWMDKSKEEDKIFSLYIRKNKLIDLKQIITEIVNHKENSIIFNYCPYNLNFIVDRTKMKGDISKFERSFIPIINSKILLAKDLYSNLDKISSNFVKREKQILLGTCRDNDEYYKYIKDYYENLKHNLENMCKENLETIEDTYKDKSIFLLKTK